MESGRQALEGASIECIDLSAVPQRLEIFGIFEWLQSLTNFHQSGSKIPECSSLSGMTRKQPSIARSSCVFLSIPMKAVSRVLYSSADCDVLLYCFGGACAVRQRREMLHTIATLEVQLLIKEVVDEACFLASKRRVDDPGMTFKVRKMQICLFPLPRLGGSGLLSAIVKG